MISKDSMDSMEADVAQSVGERPSELEGRKFISLDCYMLPS